MGEEEWCSHMACTTRQEMSPCLVSGGSETRFEVIFSLRQTEGKGSCSELKMELMNEFLLRVLQRNTREA